MKNLILSALLFLVINGIGLLILLEYWLITGEKPDSGAVGTLVFISVTIAAISAVFYYNLPEKK